MNCRGQKKVKSAMAPYIKIHFMVGRYYVQSFILSAQNFAKPLYNLCRRSGNTSGMLMVAIILAQLRLRYTENIG